MLHNGQASNEKIVLVYKATNIIHERSNLSPIQ